jgi:hypothetical protein
MTFRCEETDKTDIINKLNYYEMIMHLREFFILLLYFEFDFYKDSVTIFYKFN